MNQSDTTQASAPDSLVLTIVERVATLEGVQPTELTPPLQTVIDTDALETLFGSQHNSGKQSDFHISFCYCGYEVTVHADGDVEVSDRTVEGDDAIPRSA